MLVEQFADGLGQEFPGYGFVQIGGRTGGQCSGLGAGRIVAGDDDDRNIFESLLPVDKCKSRVAIAHATADDRGVWWKMNIEQDQVGQFFTGNFQRFREFAGDENLISKVPQSEIERPLDDRIVIHHQNFPGI